MSTTTFVLGIIFVIAVGLLIGFLVAWGMDLRRDRQLLDQERQQELQEWDEE